MMTANTTPIWPILVYGAIVVIIVTAIFVLSYLLGERHSPVGRDIPYESGIDPTGSARLRYDARYYLVGVFFILFDIEAAILFGWAVAFRELGWAGYTTAALFVITLAIGLVYIWRLRGLDWYPAAEGRRGEEPE